MHQSVRTAHKPPRVARPKPTDRCAPARSADFDSSASASPAPTGTVAVAAGGGGRRYSEQQQVLHVAFHGQALIQLFRVERYGS